MKKFNQSMTFPGDQSLYCAIINVGITIPPLEDPLRIKSPTPIPKIMAPKSKSSQKKGVKNDPKFDAKLTVTEVIVTAIIVFTVHVNPKYFKAKIKNEKLTIHKEIPNGNCNQ